MNSTALIFLLNIWLINFNNCLVKNELIITCSKNIFVEKDNAFIEVNYLNNSQDTIVLPTPYLKYSENQELIFNDLNMYCTATTKMAWPLPNSSYSFQELKKIGFDVIAPSEFLIKQFYLNDLGCIGYELESKKTYTYRVKLNIDEKFKNY